MNKLRVGMGSFIKMFRGTSVVDTDNYLVTHVYRPMDQMS